MYNSNKKNLRVKNREIRAALTESGAIVDVSKAIVEKIIETDYFKAAKHIMIFHPKEGEIDLLELLEVEGKQFYLPRCSGEELEICAYCSDNELCVNKYGIKEPVCTPIKDLAALDIIFIPALGADLNGNRIGYGGGYYDRFFAANAEILNTKKVVVLPSDLVCENIECESFDVRYDELITD